MVARSVFETDRQLYESCSFPEVRAVAGVVGLEPTVAVLETAGLATNRNPHVKHFSKNSIRNPPLWAGLDETKTTLRPSRHNSPPHPLNPDGYGSDVFVEGLSHLYALIHL